MFPLLPLWGLKSMLQKEDKDQLLKYAKKLRLKYTQICNGMTCTGDIVAQLFQGEVLTSKERDDIQHLLLTPVRANEQLLNTLMMKEDRAYDCFFTALIDTGQRHITEILINEDKCLHMEHSLTIQRNYVSLVDNLDVDSGHLLGRLYEARAVTERDLATINAMPTRHLKSEALLALVSKFSPANFEIFLQALNGSSQEHVVGIITGILYAKTECNASTPTAEAAVECADFRLQETFQNNAETKGDSNHLRDKQLRNIRHCSGMIRTSSYHAKRKSSITVGNRFINLLNDLQNEISLKVAVLRQKTVLPPGADIEICFRNLLRGFIHLKIEVSEKHTDVEDKILKRANDSTQKFETQFEDKFRTDLQLLNEELLLLRTNNRNLDGTLNVTNIELLQEKQKNRELERQLEQYSEESVNVLQQRDELRRQLCEEKRLRDEGDMNFLAQLSDKASELHKEKQKNRALERKLEQLSDESANVQQQRDELQGQLSEETRLGSERNMDFVTQIMDKVSELDNEKQKNRELERQLEQYNDESVNVGLLQQRDELQRQLCEEKRLRDEGDMNLLAQLSDKGEIFEERTRYLVPLAGFITVTTVEPDMITFDDDPTQKRAKMPCGHVIGPESMIEYCRSILQAQEYKFHCPAVTCHFVWQYFLVRHVACLFSDEMYQVEKKIAYNYLTRSRENKRCPGCRIWCFRAPDALSNCVRCPICTKASGRVAFTFCWDCEKEWKSSGCEGGCASKERRLQVLANCPVKNIGHCIGCPTVRGCLNCGFLIEHESYCAHVRCSSCRCEFCFICLREKKDVIWPCTWEGTCKLAPRQTSLP